MQTVVISNFVLNILISGALSYLWGLINCLQIVSHFPLINVLMPANCRLLFSILIKMATFDLLPVDGIMEFIAEILTATDDSSMVEQNFNEFGFDTTDPIQNLGVIFLFLAGLTVTPIVFRLLQFALSWSTVASKALIKFKTTVLIWNTYLRFVLEAFFELSIVGFLRIQTYRTNTTEDAILTFCAALLITMLAVFMVSSPFFLVRNRKYVQT